jgi:hypothetical protein
MRMDGWKLLERIGWGPLPRPSQPASAPAAPRPADAIYHAAQAIRLRIDAALAASRDHSI